MRRTRSKQKVPCVLSNRLGKHSLTDAPHCTSTSVGSKRQCTTEEEEKGNSIHKRLNHHAHHAHVAKGNAAGSSQTTTHRRPGVDSSSSNVSDSPMSRKWSLHQAVQSSSEERNDNVKLVHSDDTESDSDVVVINKSRLLKTTKRQQKIVDDHPSAHKSKRCVRSQNGVLDSDNDSEHDTIEGQVTSSANDISDNSDDSEVILRRVSVESSSDVTSASSTHLNLRILQLETELRQLKKTMWETINKKNEEIGRLQNCLKWKDEQIEGMNELVNRNMLLEAKLKERVREKENDEVARTQSIRQKDKHIESMNELSNRNMELEARIKVMHGDKKNEVIERLQNNLKWKDEQIEGMNELMNRNMELEARIKEILADKKAYKKEVENAEREQTERETRQKDKESDESTVTVSRRAAARWRTSGREAATHTNTGTSLPSKDMRKPSKDTRTSGKDTGTPTKDKRISNKDTGIHGKETRTSNKDTGIPTKNTRTSRKDTGVSSKERRMSSKDIGTPTGRSQKGLRSTRQKKSASESGDMDDIDKLFLESDTDGKDVDDKVEQSGKTIGKGEKKVEEKLKENAEKPGKSGEKQENEKEEKKEDGEEEEEDENSQHKGRKQIHKLLKGQKLLGETKAAAKAEKVRRDRLKKEHEQHLVVTEKDPKSKQTITTRLVLAFKKGTKSPLIEVNQRLIRRMKPHQVEAVEFLWDNLIESVDRLKSDDPGQGCILAHCMGLGKTLSVIGLVHTLLCNRVVNFKHCLIVCPLNTVLNWQHEWQKWLDKKDRVTVHELASSRNNHERVIKLQKWQKSGGVMVMGYQIFRILSSYSGRSKKTKAIFDETLVDPGPDIIVCDEGHILKNDASAISKSMNRIRTKKRVILTGTPLQNNLTEYHCMVSFVKPNLLGTRREFCNRFVNPITNGQHSDSTAADVKLMKRRAHVLHEMLDGCVQRRDYSALTKFLPPKHEYVIAVRLSPLQVALYRKYQELHVPMQEDGSVAKGVSLFSDYQNLMRIWTHPWVLRLDEIRQEKRAVYESDDDPDLLETSEEEEMEEDEEEVEEGEVTTSSTEESNDTQTGNDGKTETRTCRTRKGRKMSSGENGSKEDDSDSDVPGRKKAKIIAGEVIRAWKSSTRGTKYDDGFGSLQQKKEKAWWSSFVNEEQHKNCVELSGKLVLLFQIVKLAEQLGDKVLLFSQSLLTLDLIEDVLASKTEETEKKQKGKGRKSEKGEMWVKEEDYLRMDGATDPQQRKRFTNAFNDPKQSRLRLFLISTRAGGLGINLERANRVIIFDASWNPSHDIQSIFRVYRFGQTKPVYVYRFLAQGTMEEKIYERQVTKETLSQRVIDEHQIDRHFTAHDLQELYLFTPDQVDAPDRSIRPTPVIPKDVVLAELLSSSRDWIVQYHEHDSLLVNHPEEDLSEEERQAAWDEYEREKQGLYSYPNMVMSFPGVAVRPPMVGPATGPRPVSQPPTQPLANTTMQLLTTQHPKLNFQIAQLPRVVQEILKYNPNITAEELQSRLQAFLGMNARYSVPGHAMGPTSSQATSSQPAPDRRNLLSTVTKTSTPSTVTGLTGMLGQPRIFLPGTSNVNLPSRLPTPGKVPAMTQQK